MSKAPIVETRRRRGVSELRDRQRKTEAQALAVRFSRAFMAATEGKHPDFVIEAARTVIRTMSKIVEDRGDLGRAQGVLAGAATDLSPAWTGHERTAHHALAETVFTLRQEAA